MDGLTLKHLRYLVAVADHGQFSRAAGACAISQPALSQQIKEVEALIGEPLFERNARHVTLTPLGKDAVARARSILTQVQDFGDFVAASRERLSGTLRLGIIPTIAPYLLPRVIGTLRGAYPELTVRPREGVTAQLIEDLARLQIDAALLALPVGETAFEEFPLFSEEFVLVRHASEAAAPVPDPAMLSQMELLLLEEGHCFRDQALSLCNLGGPAARRFMEAGSLSTLVQMVATGFGLTVIPEMAIALETRGQGVSVSRFEAPAPERHVGLVWRRSNPMAPRLRALGGLFQDSLAR
ncbi:MAG: LysR substrate-binding domain-containing protein [Pseudomonadota bacterium]